MSERTKSIIIGACSFALLMLTATRYISMFTCLLYKLFFAYIVYDSAFITLSIVLFSFAGIRSKVIYVIHSIGYLCNSYFYLNDMDLLKYLILPLGLCVIGFWMYFYIKLMKSIITNKTNHEVSEVSNE